ncbi:MAG: RNA methyltransferase substrate-binding domain-containing protein, partial [Geminicoccaceae bacterium]
MTFTPRTPRVVAARRLQRRRDRDQTGRFLAEGPQAVREALAAGVVLELFGTGAALARHADLAAQAPQVSPVTEEALAALAETVQPQGLVALCEQVDVPLADALAKKPRLVAVAAEIRD